jgi:hypothetical protein
MSEEITDEVVDKIVEDAQAEFDLFDAVVDRPKVEDSVRLFMDEVTGKALGYAVDVPNPNPLGKTIRERSGVIGKIDELEPLGSTLAEDVKELAELKKQAADLRAKLVASSFTVTLRAFPEIVEKVAKRETRKRFMKKGEKKFAEDVTEDAERFFLQSLLSAAIVEIKQANGATRSNVTVDELEILQSNLPKPEWTRLNELLDEVQYSAKIAHDAGQDLDF